MPTKKADEQPTISKLETKGDEKFIKSGIPEFDELTGGFPRGRITELWGDEGVGKTYLVTKLMSHLSKDNKVLYIDTEFALNKARVAALGADPKNIDYVADSRLEKVCELLIASVAQYDVIILDSLAFLVPETVDNQEVGENAIGLFSRLIKHWVVKFRPRLGASNTAFIAINQARKTISMYTKPEPPGGRAWGHTIDVRIQLSSNSVDKVLKNGVQVGHRVHAVVKKSKVSQPFKEAIFIVEY